MNAIIYLLQVSACLAVFYVFYYTLLNRLTFFTLNRWYLLVTLLISFIIPLLTISIPQQQHSPIVEQVIEVNTFQMVTANKRVINHIATSGHRTATWMELLEWFYILAVLVLAIRLFIAIILLVVRLNRKEVKRVEKYNIVRGNKKLPNGSFFNYIFINDDELNADEIRQVIAHEMLHVQLFHSLDRILIKIAQIILWFNPFVYLYARLIEENHEFEVDREMTHVTDKSGYANLLLHLSVAGQGTLYHNFSKVPLKKRINRLFNKPSANMKKIIYLLILPLLVISCLAFAKLQTIHEPSAVGDLSRLGAHPLVIINGKEYPDDILYKISGSCITSYATRRFSTIAKYKDNAKAKDGVVEITTQNGEITYLTAVGKENLIKEAAVPRSKFYTRLKLKNEDGSDFEKAIVNTPSGSQMTDNINAADKVVFIYNGQAYPEKDVNKVEELVKANDKGGWECGTGHVTTKAVEGLTKADLSAYQVYFYFRPYTASQMPKGSQLNQNQTPTSGKVSGNDSFDEYRKTQDYKDKEKILSLISGKTLTVKIKDVVNGQNGQQRGFLISYQNHDYVLDTRFGQDKDLRSLLKPGENATISFKGGGFSKDSPELGIEAARVYKNDKIVFQLAEAAPLPTTAFLTEANNVHVVDGQVTDIQKYADGKWMSAVVEEVNGNKFLLKIKPTAPAFTNIGEDDHVRLRFVNQIPKGEKDFIVKDWISLSANLNDYGIKNPELFNQFYQEQKKTVL